MGAIELIAEDVTLAYHRGDTPVVSHASLRIGTGEAVGIVGESGSGKTTLARALVGELPPRSGSITVNGRAWSIVRRRDRERRAVQMIFQDPYSALNPRMTARETVAEALQIMAGTPRRSASAAAVELLVRAGLSETVIDRSPRRLSGGQRQRVVIARALAGEPEILIADEPTSSLDVSVQAQILNLLIDLRAERGIGLVLVTHDLTLLAHMTDRVAVMYGGRIVEEGPTEQLLAAPAHPYTAQLMAAHAPDLSSWTASPGLGEPAPTQACVYAPRCPRASDICREAYPATAAREAHRWACYHPNAGYESPAGIVGPDPAQRVRTVL